MAKNQDQFKEKWNKLSGLQKQLLQILAALSDKGAETDVLSALAGTLYAERPADRLFEQAWKDLDPGAEVWFTKTQRDAHRKLRAPARKLLPELRDETPGWPPRFHEKLFDGLALIASDAVHEAAAWYRDRLDLRNAKFFKHLAHLYPDLVELRAAEAAALLAAFYGFTNKAKEYAHWLGLYQEWTLGTPLPKTPLLFLGVHENRLPGEYGVFYMMRNGGQRDKQTLKDLEQEPWTLENADALAEYLETVVPGETASVYQTLVLRALAARPAYEERDDLPEARRRLGDYDTLLNNLPDLPHDTQSGKRRRVALRADFYALALKLEDCADEVGPVSLLRHANLYEVEDPEDEGSLLDTFAQLAKGGMMDSPHRAQFRQVGRMIEELPDDERIPVYRGGTGKTAVANARAAFPEVLKKLGKKCDGEIIRKLDKFLSKAATARANGVLDEWLQDCGQNKRYLEQEEFDAELQYLLLRADQELEKLDLDLTALDENELKAVVNLRLNIAVAEEICGKLPDAFILARGYTEMLGATGEQVWQFAQTELAAFFSGLDYPGRAAATYRRWLDWADDQPASSGLIVRIAEIEVKYFEMLLGAGRYAAAEQIAREELPQMLISAFGQIEQIPALLACWVAYFSWIRGSAAIGVEPDYAPVQKAFERQLEELENGEFMILPLRLQPQLMLRAARAERPDQVAEGLLDALAYLKDDLPGKVAPEKRQAREIEPQDELLTVFALTMFSLQPDQAVELMEEYAPDLLLAALCLIELEKAEHQLDEHYPKMLRPSVAAPNEQPEGVSRAIQFAAQEFRGGFDGISEAVSRLQRAISPFGFLSDF